jgi:hypothetical protein
MIIKHCNVRFVLAALLPLTRSALDEAAGLDPGVSGGALAPNFSRRLAAQSLYNLLGAMGLVLVIMDDSAANERCKKIINRFPKRHDDQVRWGNRAAKAGKAKEAMHPKKSRSAKRRVA